MVLGKNSQHRINLYVTLSFRNVTGHFSLLKGVTGSGLLKDRWVIVDIKCDLFLSVWGKGQVINNR